MGTDQLKELKRLQKENERLEKGRIRLDFGQAHLGGGGQGKPLIPARRRACIDRVRTELNVSERRACRVLRQHRSTQRKTPVGRTDEEHLVADMIELARQYG